MYPSFEAGAADFVYASYVTSFRSISANGAIGDGSLTDAGRSFVCVSSAGGLVYCVSDTVDTVDSDDSDDGAGSSNT